MQNSALQHDTIVAISTPRGEGGIGIVRLSGSSSLSIIESIFLPRYGKFNATKSHKITYGHIVDPNTNEYIDEVLVTVMLSPKTYTREDIIEVNCHGGSVPISKILELTLGMGARLAEPGEFTKRAFLNGRIDLAQAEAVADIIRAKTDLSLKIAVGQLEGHLSKKVNGIRSELLELLASVEASIDFSDEDLDFITYDDITDQTQNIINKLNSILDSAEDGRIITEGIKGVIIGRPNVGKSSLFNALLKEKRAIVTSIPGTTRDPIEEFINLDGIPLKLTDTAGIRGTDNIIEIESIDRTMTHLDQADLILLILDNSEALTEDDREIISYIVDKRAIVIVNKIDLLQVLDPEELRELVEDKPIIYISTIDESDLHMLKSAIRDAVIQRDFIQSDPVFVTKVWQKNSIKNAIESLRFVVSSAQAKAPAELISVDLRGALKRLGEIVGETTSEEILNQIFARFCIGK
jgi:tRNA modification GTPase